MHKYQLVRSRRRTLSLQIKHGQLIVCAPMYMSIDKIKEHIKLNANWIDKHLSKITIKQYKNNNKFLYLGKQYPLILSNDNLYFDGKNFVGNANKEQFLKLYKNDFKKIATARLKYFAIKYNFKYNKVYFKAQKTIWGSCSMINNINLNYLLMMAPIKIIDSVIAHELCHTIHKNHSKDFWNLLYSVIPDYKNCYKWLKQHDTDLHNL